jgi:hypothetical protein
MPGKGAGDVASAGRIARASRVGSSTGLAAADAAASVIAPAAASKVVSVRARMGEAKRHPAGRM